MRTGDLPHSMYTPIPQNMTDSESEEEFHLQINHCPLRNNQILARNFKPSSNVHATISRYSGHISGDRQNIVSDSLVDVRFTNTQSNYCANSDGEDRPYISMTNHSRIPSDAADNVAILNSNLRKSQPMSNTRKVCFILSIFVCILTVILFVWVLPCTDNHTCPAKSERIHTHNWLRNYERVELKGTINVVRGVRGRSMNLVFMYRGNHFFKNDDTANNFGSMTKRNGIISLIGSSGQVAWYDELVNEPSIIDCNLIDADLSGDNDCIVIDEFGEMSCINPISGQWIWHLAEHTSNIPEKLNFPLVLPDINNDRVNDLLIACTITNRNRTYNALKLISGAKGTQIGQSFVVKKCSYIHKFQIDSQLKISFNCIINETDIRITKSLQDLFNQMTNQTIKMSETNGEIENRQHKFYGQRKDTLRQRNIYTVNEKQLIVENYGICPESCNVTVTLLEEKNGKPKIIRNFNGTRMYGMVPARLSFNNSNDPSKSSVHGFVIKFWEWSSKQKNKTDLHGHRINKRTTNHSFGSEFNRFDYVLRKKRSWDPTYKSNGQNIETIRSNRSNNGSASNGSGSGSGVAVNGKNSLKKNVASTLSDKINSAVLASQMRLIKETVVLIVFNSTDTRIENTSQSNIVQFCRTDSKRNEICQPDLNNQENSVLIADLDQDGSQEMVSYYSTFVENENEVNKWKLMTYVQLLRLESELPKLYATDEKH